MIKNDPDGFNYDVNKIVYLTAEEAAAYYIIVDNDDFREMRDKAIEMEFELACAYNWKVLWNKWCIGRVFGG